MAERNLLTAQRKSGLHRAKTNGSGFVYFKLPVTAGYVLSVKVGDQSEILYLENLKPGVDYVYRPDPEIHSGRADALVPVPSE